MSTAASSPRCAPLFSLRGTPAERRRPGQTSHVCGPIDRVASWVGNGVAAAFFASLERCSCMTIDTHEDGDDVKRLPLIRDDGNAAGREWRAAAMPSRQRRDQKRRKRGSFFEDDTDVHCS